MPTSEAVFVVLLGPNDIRNARAIARIRSHGMKVAGEFNAMDVDFVYFRIFNTGPMGLLSSG